MRYCGHEELITLLIRVGYFIWYMVRRGVEFEISLVLLKNLKIKLKVSSF